MRLTILILALAWLMLSLLRIAALPQQTWNWHACRLAPVVAMARGIPLYNGPDSGPISSHIYGPVWPIAMLPAAIWRSPTSIILIGGVLTLAWYFIPLALMVLRGAADGARSALALFGCGLWSMSDSALQGSAYWVHVDAVALGLGAIACAALIRARPSPSGLLTSGIAAALCVWTKQTFAPILVVLPVYLWLRDGRRVGLSQLLITTGSAALLGLGFAAVFGASNMVFNMFIVPSHHPFRQSSAVVALMDAGTQTLIHSAAPLVLLYIAITVQRDFTVHPLRQFLLRNPWTLPAALGLAMLPTGMLGFAKVGGHPNNLSNIAYFLLAAGAMALARVKSGRAGLALTGFAIAGAALAIGDPRKLAAEVRVARHPWNNPQETIYRYAKAHPRQGYFPWNTLSTLLADGRLYHLDWGLVDRRLAGFAPTPAHLKAGMPSSLRFIALPPDAPSQATRPEGVERQQRDDLSGFDIYPQ